MKRILLYTLLAAIAGLIIGVALSQGYIAPVWAYAFGGAAFVLLVDAEMRRRFPISTADWHRLAEFNRALDQL